MDARDVAALNDGEYEQLVVIHAHPRRREADVWAALIHPDNIDRTRTAATTVHARTAATIRWKKAEREKYQQECHARGYEGKQEWFASKPEFEQWKRRTGNFHQMMQAAIAELGRAKRDTNRAQGDRGVGQQRDTLRKLAVAIHRHQAAHARAGGIAEQADYELWRLLDTLTVPIGHDQEAVSLRTMLDIYWADVEPVTAAEEGANRAERSMRSAPAGQSGQYAGVPRARHVHNGKDLA
ncbi:hypothetical protein [Streptomyces sp. NBC_01353]|uniref:hypothetical protein n=1 Tax=Streptomyces sp. NBC_01353 TaxID=2903835 RepID=UPI002E326FA8|nr:hypothetical protein [Streptomyces sp. NBC_01353]